MCIYKKHILLSNKYNLEEDFLMLLHYGYWQTHSHEDKVYEIGKEVSWVPGRSLGDNIRSKIFEA